MVSKNMTIDGYISSNKTRYIQIGNNHWGNSARFSWPNHLNPLYWSISEVQAFDKNGKDIALKKKC